MGAILYSFCIIMYTVSMIQRKLLADLRAWLKKQNRKPLILRGARQVGKTTLVNMFAADFRQFLSFNLERTGDREVFEQDLSFEKTLEALFFLRNAGANEPSTLLFIDEIQNSAKAVSLLRFFYEQRPDIPVIAAGSLLETVIDTYKISFPVGRVEYMYLHPFSFREYLGACAGESVQKAFDTLPIPEYAQTTLLSHFHDYALLGGMPEIVKYKIEQGDLYGTSTIYESLLTSYIDDAAKYSSGRSAFQVLRHTIESAPLEAGKRIRFQGFGNSAYRSREIGEALRTLERAMLIHLLYPVTSHSFPVLQNKKKSPRLLFLDVGLMNFRAGIQNAFLGVKDLNSLYNGLIAEQIVGQELLSLQGPGLHPPLFWVNEKAGSTAEVDYLFPYQGKLIPLEVKSGKTGTLRSLHQYINRSGLDIAVRLYSGSIKIDTITTPDGRPFRLLNLPYYLTGNLTKYLDWLVTTS